MSGQSKHFFIITKLLTFFVIISIFNPCGNLACKQSQSADDAGQNEITTAQTPGNGTTISQPNSETTQTPSEKQPLDPVVQQPESSSPLLTILSIIDGKVWVQKKGGLDWVLGEEGMTLDVKDKIKTDAGSSATIVFFEGSVIELQGETEIGIDQLGVLSGDSTIIKVKQDIGTTISRVKKLIDPESIYEIETIAAVVGVRGTTMKVSVADDGVTVVENIEGLVSVVAQGQEVAISEGERSTIIPGEAPGPSQSVPPGPITVELAYDTGNPTSSVALGNQGHGYLVRFSAPGTPFTINRVRVYGNLYGTGYEDKQFVLRITNTALEPILDNSYSCSLFSRTPSWIDIIIPDLFINGDFGIEVFTNSLGTGGIAIFYDSSVANQHSGEIQDWAKEEWKLAIPRGTTNWMIRVVGTYLP
jgi:hypothetical protein